MTIDTSREAIDRMTGMWGVGVEPNMARVTEVLTALTSERDEALAQVAALMDLVRETALHLERVSDYDAPRLLLRVNAAVSEDAAEARDAALVERGRRDGIEEAARVAHEMAELRAVEYHAGSHDHSREYAEGAMDASGEIADAIAHRVSVAHRALATPPADGGPR
jgi:hypothetical protein